MAVYQSPGIYVKETDLSQIVTALSASQGAVVGYSKQGPIMYQFPVSSVKDFVDYFGEPDPQTSFMHYSAIPFLSVAKVLYVTRVVGTGALHAGLEIQTGSPGSLTPPTTIAPTAWLSQVAGYTFTANTGSFLIYAIGPGAYANSQISVQVTNLNVAVTPHQFDIIVSLTKPTTGVAVQVERWTVAKSYAVDGNGQQLHMEAKINNKSRYIKVYNNALVTGDPFPMASAQFLAGGVDGALPAASVYEGSNGWGLYSNVDSVNVNILMSGGWNATSTQLVMDGIAAGRQDAVAILNVPTASQDGVSGELTYRNSTLNLNSSYSAIYTPDLYIYDQYTNQNIYVPPDGYVGSIFALTEFLKEAWYAPAGLNRGLVRVLQLRQNYSQGYRDQLYAAQVNTFRNFPGLGIALWGQKTLKSIDSALSRVNVRRLLIVVEKSVAKAMYSLAFELNNIFTRAQASAMVDGFMRQIKAKNGVYDYRIVCDTTNNPPEIIDANQMNIDIYLQPQKAAEFIQLQAVITRTGANFNTLIATGGNF